MEVRRASQTHQVPQVGLPQTAPVNRARKVSQSPTGATAFTNTSASFMRQSLEAAGFPMDELNQAGEINYGEKLKPIDDEAKAWKTVWSAGQGVSQIHDVLSVSELVSRLTEEYRNARERLLSTGS